MLGTHADLPTVQGCKLPKRWALGCPTSVEDNPRPQLILGNSLFLTLSNPFWMLAHTCGLCKASVYM